MESTKTEPELSRIEQLEARRDERKQATAKARNDQYAIDLETRELLEDEHGAVAAVEVSRFVQGQPTLALVKTPSAAQYKRYKDQLFKSAQTKNSTMSREAQELLANACWVYPSTADERAAMLATFPGLLTPLSIAAMSLAEGRQEEEGKG